MASLMLPDPGAAIRAPLGPRQPQQRKVTRDRFVKLLVSRKKLRRWSDAAAGLIGLIDESAGVVYVINHAELA